MPVISLTIRKRSMVVVKKDEPRYDITQDASVISLFARIMAHVTYEPIQIQDAS